MAIGVLLGAWIFSKHGWPDTWLAFGVCVIAALVDQVWGRQIGHAMAQMTLALFH